MECSVARYPLSGGVTGAFDFKFGLPLVTSVAEAEIAGMALPIPRLVIGALDHPLLFLYHLNVVRTMGTDRAGVSADFRWSLPYRGSYCVLQRALREAPSMTVSHVKAHTKGGDTLSLLNARADALAAEAHLGVDVVVPFPTAFLPEWAILDGSRWWEGNVASRVKSALLKLSVSQLSDKTKVRLCCLNLLLPLAPSSRPYKKVLSTTAAKVQLLRRGN